MSYFLRVFPSRLIDHRAIVKLQMGLDVRRTSLVRWLCSVTGMCGVRQRWVTVSRYHVLVITNLHGHGIRIDIYFIEMVTRAR